MDFDEYEYLEKSVDELAAARSKRKRQLSEETRQRGRKTRDEDDDDQVKRKTPRSGDDDDGGEMKRKMSRSGDDEDRRERKRDERDRGRDRSRDRDRSRERRDRERHRERRGNGGRDRERSRHREMEKDRSRPSNSRSGRRGSLEPVKDTESDKDKERTCPESSRSRPRRDGSREPEKDTESDKDKERECPGRSRSQSRRDSSREPVKDKESELKEMEMRDSRRFKDKKETEPEADPERDQRTVFAYQMPLKAVERDVYEFFSKAGKVRDARVIMDRSSRRSKGVGYIEFYDAMSVPLAIALSGQLLLGKPVMVKPSEAEKNLVQSTAATGSSVSGPYGQTDRKLYVGNLHFNVTEQQIRTLFEAFGPVELVQLPLDIETGQCKGFGFVQFAEAGHAKAAAQNLNGQVEIAGRYIKVSSVSEHVSGQDAGTNAADFDDDYGGGLSLNAQSRALLMQKLDRTGTASGINVSLGLNGLNGSAPTQHLFPMPFNGQVAIPALPSQVLPAPIPEPIGNPSECLLLKNLFDPATETDPEFDLDIKDDVGEECSKFGRVRHIRVDRHSDGHVYLRFDNKEDAMSAQHGMHMRWFARRLISAIFMPSQDYERRFPDVVW